MRKLRLVRLNQVNLIGRITKDPELKYTPNGTKHLSCNLAVDDGYFNKSNEYIESTCFIKIDIWSGVDRLMTSLKKGDPVLIEGRLKQNTFEKDGEKVSYHEISVERCQILERDVSDAEPGF